MNVKWIYQNGTHKVECTSFPFAFRTMFVIAKKAVEAGKTLNEVTKAMSITGPIAPGAKVSTYSYASATSKASEQGLLTPDGQINSREFKHS